MELTIFVCLVWTLSVCLHEFGHAVVAYLGGDTSVKDKGYLTLNIFKYTDPAMTLFVPLFALMMGGIALPGAAVYIENWRLRNRLWASAVALAGPMMTFIMMVLLSLPFTYHVSLADGQIQQWLVPGLAFLVVLQGFVTVVNLLPIPPLDGYGVIEPWLPRTVQEKMRIFGRYSIWLVFLALWFVQPFYGFVWGTTNYVVNRLGVPIEQAQEGLNTFRDNAYLIVILIIGILFLINRTSKRQQPTSLDWYRLAGELQAEKKYKEAVLAYDKAIESKPDFAFAWNNRGLACAMLTEYNQAIGNFSKAIELDPANADFYYNKACCYSLQGLSDPALQNLERAIQLNPTALKEHAKKDSGFKSLHDNPRFRQLVEMDQA